LYTHHYGYLRTCTRYSKSSLASQTNASKACIRGHRHDIDPLLNTRREEQMLAKRKMY
jgi:hypothetical protein